MVYKWFYLVFHLCYGTGIVSGIVFLLYIFGIIELFYHSYVIPQISTLAIYYALYFGVLGRDFADMCSEQMASTLGVLIFIFLKNTK